LKGREVRASKITLEEPPKMRAILRWVTTGILAAASLNAAAALTQYKDWDKSPEYQILATDGEKKEWKKVSKDEEAEKFISLFWARRNPDPKNPINAFKVRFDAFVSKADEVFKLGKKRGALTERGRLFILVGQPTSIIPTRNQGIGGSLVGGGSSSSGLSATESVLVTYTFHYDQDKLPAWAGLKSFDAAFTVDPSLQIENILEAGPVRRIEKLAVEAYLVHPELKEAPVYKTKEQVEAEQKAANEAAAELAKGPALSAPVKEALEALLAKEPFGPLSLMSLSYRDSATRLMAQVNAGPVASPQGVKLAILVRDKAGKDVVRVEEAADLQKSQGDYFTDRALRVLPGDYDVAAGLFDASDKLLVSARKPATVAPLPTAGLAASALFVAANDFPATGTNAEEAFTFSARKFVGRGDGHLDVKDGLSYAVRVYNPAVDPATKTMTLRRSLRIKPKSGPAVDVPQPEDQPAPAPPEIAEGKATAVIDLAGSIVEANLGEYFRPGEYELRVTITDVVSGKKIDLVAPFTLTGTLPQAAKPTPAPAAPKKK
jgi:GWxTD domain-containing protein